MRFQIGFRRFWVFLILLLFPFRVGAQLPETSPATQPTPSEMDPDRAMTEKYRERFKVIEEELVTLNARLDEGQKEIQSESAKLATFLQIAEITPEEFQPYQIQWKVMRDSYRDVLKEVNRQIDELNQIRIRLESKQRLWELKEGDLKLMRDQSPKGKANPELVLKLSETRKMIQELESEGDNAEDLLTRLGKTKTALTLALDECNKNYALLQERWKEVRFTYLKMRQQPKFSFETLHMAAQEFQYRLKDYSTSLKALKSYGGDSLNILGEKPLRTLLSLGIFFFSVWGLFELRRRGLRECKKPEEITLLERFGRRFFVLWTGSFPVLIPLLLFLIFLLSFADLREPIGLFLLFAFSGLYGTWLLNRSLKILLVDQREKTRLLAASPEMGRSLYRRLSLLTRLVYFYIVIQLSSSILGYESEATRLIHWFLIILVFGVLISLFHPRWGSVLGEEGDNKFSAPFCHTVRIVLILMLIAVIGLDAAGYTYFSDYLANSSLKSLSLIPLFLFLKKGIVELIDYKIFTRSLTQLHIPEELRMKWKKTLKQWTRLSLSLLLIYWICRIWGVTPELWDALKWIMSRGFTVGGITITVGLLVSVFLTLYAAVLISRLIRAILEKNLYPRRQWDPGIRNAISTGIHYLIILIGLIISLRLLGFDVRNITVLAGAFGVGLGFGLQNLANNFASGIVLLIERPVKVGDVIQVGNLIGKVKKIGARSTVIETVDQSAILIPNGELLAGQVTNWTYGNSVGGISIPVGVAYGSEVDLVKRVLLKTAEDHPDVLKKPAPQVEFNAFGDSSLNFILRVWANVEERRDIQTQLMFQLEKALRENKIVIPYPHREVILRKD